MESVVNENEKLCFDCKTSKTPLWRTGPAGPKSLCNACGIRYRKKSETKPDKKKDKQESSPSPSTSSATDDKRENGGELRKKLRVKVVAMMQGPRSPMKKVKRIESDRYKYKMMRRRSKFGEVEEAAYLLMCLSCG